MTPVITKYYVQGAPGVYIHDANTNLFRFQDEGYVELTEGVPYRLVLGVDEMNELYMSGKATPLREYYDYK